MTVSSINGGSAGPDGSDERTVEELLEAAEKSRTRVTRVLEYVRGDRDAGDVRKGDWFAAIEYVADETGEDLVLYSESEHSDAYSSATILAVDDKFGRIIQFGWSEFKISTHQPGYIGPGFVNRDDIEDGFRFESGRPRKVLRLEDAKERVREFAAEHGGDAE